MQNTSQIERPTLVSLVGIDLQEMDDLWVSASTMAAIQAVDGFNPQFWKKVD